MRFTGLLFLGSCALLSGCTGFGLPKTMGETSSAYGYIPLDPLPIDQAANADSCKSVAKAPETVAVKPSKAKAGTGKPSASPTPPAPSTQDETKTDPSYLSKLPDQTIRFAVASFDATGSLTFGPSKLTSKGKQYRAVLDYIQADAVPVEFYVKKLIARVGKDGQLDDNAKSVPLDTILPPGFIIAGYDVQESSAQALARSREKPVFSLAEFQKQQDELANYNKAKVEQGYSIVTFPVYVGVGLRLSADVLALEGGVTLAGLGSIGADAEAKKISGTLTVQALGVSGRSIATALPLPSKLDQTTIENAILAVGNMRATLYANSVGIDGVWIRPRVVGLYSPIGSHPSLINAIYSQLSRTRPRWYVPCGS